MKINMMEAIAETEQRQAIEIKCGEIFLGIGG